MHEPLRLDSPPSLFIPSPSPKEGIVLCCLIRLGARINELFFWVCVFLSACLQYFAVEMKKKKGGFAEWMVVMPRSTGWKSGPKRSFDSKVDVRPKEEGRNAKEMWERAEDKNMDRSSKRRRLFWGLSIEAISTDWLCHCVTQRAALKRPCVCVRWVGMLRASAVVRSGGHVPLLDTLQQSHIVKPHSPQRERLHFFVAPPPCSQIMIVLYLFGRTRKSGMMAF